MTLSLHSLAGRTGHGVRIAVIDSGVHAGHPHVGGIAGGASFDDTGRPGEDVVDRLGHGTAVAAAIHEKAPQAELLMAKVFDRSLSATGRALEAAIDWASHQRVTLVNLSLGTTNSDHADRLSGAIERAARAGALVIAAAPDGEHRWLPGGLRGVMAVSVDWQCARESCEITFSSDGHPHISASGYPRPIPGVSPERNVKGQSFAVANATGLLALAIEGALIGSIDDLKALLQTYQPR